MTTERGWREKTLGDWLQECAAYLRAGGSFATPCRFDEEYAEKLLLAADALSAAQRSGWQPIETAPTDGEPDLLLFGEELGLFIGHWEAEKYPEDPQAYIPAGWWGHLCYPLDTETQPTHWHPLPGVAALLSERSPQPEKADALPVSHGVSAENQPPEHGGQ